MRDGELSADLAVGDPGIRCRRRDARMSFLWPDGRLSGAELDAVSRSCRDGTEGDRGEGNGGGCSDRGLKWTGEIGRVLTKGGGLDVDKTGEE